MSGLRLSIKDEFGNVRSLGDNVFVGSEQPTDKDISVWIDTTSNPPTIKYLNGENYIALTFHGTNNVNSLSNIPVDRNLVVAELADSCELSVADLMVPGQEVHIIAHAFTAIEITIPTSGGYVNLTEDTISLGANEYCEINLISDGTNIYVRSL